MKSSFAKYAIALSATAVMGNAIAANSFTSEAAFTSALSGASITVESFESAPGGTSTSMIFPNVTVSCSGSTYCPGFFGVSGFTPTDGVQGVFFATPDTITFSFSAPVTAFGIDVSGLGTAGATDFSGSLSNGASATFFSNYFGNNVGSLFVGFVDKSGFSSVTFSGTQGDDGIYFDRMQIAAVPEPESYAMLMAGLGLMGLIARRRKIA